MGMIASKILISIILVVLGVLRHMGKCFSKRELGLFRRYNATNENIILYGKQSGTGMIIFGITFIAGNYIYQQYNTTIGCVILLIGVITFIGMHLNATSKYIRK